MKLTTQRRGFTLIEVLIATVLLSFSLIVMFGFHTQAMRSNMYARKLTDCTYLSQMQMERLLSMPWTDADRPDELLDSESDPTTSGDLWAYLEHPNGSGVAPNPVNAKNNSDEDQGPLNYYLTWDVADMDDEGTWARIRVRCIYEDEAFNTWRGTTIASYRFQD